MFQYTSTWRRHGWTHEGREDEGGRVDLNWTHLHGKPEKATQRRVLEGRGGRTEVARCLQSERAE